MQAAYLIGNVAFPTFTAGVTLDQKHTLGTKIAAEDPYWGPAEFVYCRAVGAVTANRLMNPDVNFNLVDVPNTANTGATVGVMRQPMAALAYGWLQTLGRSPVQTSAASTAGPLYVGAAGQVTSTAAAGKQLLGAQGLLAGTATVIKTATMGFNSFILQMPNTDGVFVGQAVTGTNIGASAVVTFIDPAAMLVTVSVASTAAGTNSVTFTNTGYVVMGFANCNVQGQIT